MQNSSVLQQEIFSDSLEFEKAALEIFGLQARHNIVYKAYLAQLKTDTSKINSVGQIPFLPIQLFKSQKVVTRIHPETGKRKSETIFTSSGTTGSITSKHFVTDITLYEKSFTKCFENFYGSISGFAFLALLPSYLERENSSLVYMAQKLIEHSRHPLSGFYLNEFENLHQTILQLCAKNQKFILLGVTFALLEFAEYFNRQNRQPLQEKGLGIIMETGGMKGRRKEMVREEVHAALKKLFGVDKTHSEYGMTELLSQAYSYGDGLYKSPSWMKVLIRNINDPFQLVTSGKTGGINIVDLANINSCSFIATQDLGKLHNDETFEVLGRFDYSDLRGCSLMIE